MITVGYTSDPHFGHAYMAEKRGFGTTAADIAQHDEAIVDGFAAMCPAKDDQLWILGDLVMSDPTYAIELLKARLQCELFLILGNHDRGHPRNKDAHRRLRQYFDVFTYVGTAATHKINGEKVLLSHFPYDGDHTFENRYMQWRLRDEGDWLLHGHIHSPDVFDPAHEKSIHVGLDAWDLQPVNRDQVAALMLTGTL